MNFKYKKCLFFLAIEQLKGNPNSFRMRNYVYAMVNYQLFIYISTKRRFSYALLAVIDNFERGELLTNFETPKYRHKCSKTDVFVCARVPKWIPLNIYLNIIGQCPHSYHNKALCRRVQGKENYILISLRDYLHIYIHTTILILMKQT